MNTREIIDRYYETVNNGQWEAWLTLFSDDIVGDEQLAGHFNGIDVLRGAAGALQKGYSQFKMYPVRIVVEGDSACVVWRTDSANAAHIPIGYPNDTKRQVIGANFFQIQNGKIVYMRTIHDSIPFKPFTDQTGATS